MDNELLSIFDAKKIAEPYKSWTISSINNLVENYGGKRKDELRALLIKKIDESVAGVQPKPNMKITEGAVGLGCQSIIEIGTKQADMSHHYPKNTSQEEMQKIQQTIPQVTFSHELCHLLLKGTGGFGGFEGLIQALAAEITGMDKTFQRSVSGVGESMGDEIKEYTPYNGYRESAPYATMLRTAIGSKEEFMFGALTNPEQIRTNFDKRNNELVPTWQDGAFNGVVNLIENFNIDYMGTMQDETPEEQLRYRIVLNKFLSYVLENRMKEFLSTPKTEHELLEFQQDIETFKKHMLNNSYEPKRAELPHMAKIAFIEARIERELGKARGAQQEELTQDENINNIASAVKSKYTEHSLGEQKENFYQYRVIEALKRQKFRFNDLPPSGYDLQQRVAAYLQIASELENQGLEGCYQRFLAIPDVNIILNERLNYMTIKQAQIGEE